MIPKELPQEQVELIRAAMEVAFPYYFTVGYGRNEDGYYIFPMIDKKKLIKSPEELEDEAFLVSLLIYIHDRGGVEVVLSAPGGTGRCSDGNVIKWNLQSDALNDHECSKLIKFVYSQFGSWVTPGADKHKKKRTKKIPELSKEKELSIYEALLKVFPYYCNVRYIRHQEGYYFFRMHEKLSEHTNEDGQTVATLSEEPVVELSIDILEKGKIEVVFWTEGGMGRCSDGNIVRWRTLEGVDFAGFEYGELIKFTYSQFVKKAKPATYFTLRGYNVTRVDKEVLIYYSTPYQLDYLLRHQKQLCDRYPSATITAVGEHRVQIQP